MSAPERNQAFPATVVKLAELREVRLARAAEQFRQAAIARLEGEIAECQAQLHALKAEQREAA